MSHANGPSLHRTPPLRPATALFQLFERAVERRDLAEALRIQRRLREAGFSVCYIGRKVPDGRPAS